MSAPIFIGDEISAAGFRLAGVETRTPNPDELPNLIKWACVNTSLLLITAEYAAMLSAAERQRLLCQEMPLVVTISDICAKTPLPDLVTELRSQLGVLA
ncbi:MAG: V-type ATP synthase subunit F [Synechococcus sp.]